MRATAFLLCLPIVVAAGCNSQPSAPPGPVSTRVESADLGIALASTDGFEVTANGGGRLELVPADGRPQGRVWFTVSEAATGGINLVEIVNGQKAAFEALPGGAFSGSRELVMADGRPGYYSRGQFDDDDGTRVEELRVTALHPSQNRVLQAFYRYPFADDSADRLNDLLYLVGELEGYELPEAGSKE